MGDDSVEQFWYIFWLIEAVISLGFLGALTLICTAVFGLIRSKLAQQRSFKHPIVHPLGTLPPPPSFDALEFKAIGRRPTVKKKRFG